MTQSREKQRMKNDQERPEDYTMTISFKVGDEDAGTIAVIAERAQEIYRRANIDADVSEIIMDLRACHANGNPLRLEDMLAADDFNLMHDVDGINHHINQQTGELENCFRPRFSAPCN